MSSRHLASLAVALCAAAAPVGAAPRAQAPTVADQVAPVARLVSDTLAPLASVVPRDALERAVALEHDLRDAAHATEAQLLIWASERPAIDLTVLTTMPLEDMSEGDDGGERESSGFGWRDDPFRHVSRFHTGADIHAQAGTPVHAAGAGVVVFAGRQGGYGNIVYVDHGGGVVTRYAHLRKIVTHKEAAVAAGDLIGEVGATGRATGPHLHFEVRLDGSPVDPNTALHVATLERDVPELGRLAAFALAPAVQAKVRDIGDAAREAHKSRPERRGKTPRPQILW
jgi:murein DD-endopeptidase MepM/ murein hydrolase activator NlpD